MKLFNYILLISNLYKKYIREIYVRKKQFKDELLAAVLEFFLSLPKELVVTNLNEIFYHTS